MSPVKYKIIQKKIHPPEADALADSFAKASRAALANTDELGRIRTKPDSVWEGGRKNRFMDSFSLLVIKSRGFAVGTLQRIEKGFRALPVKTVEEVLDFPS